MSTLESTCNFQVTHLYSCPMDNDAISFYRVVQDEHSTWTGLKAVMVNHERGDWCIYRYEPLDRLLILDWFDEEGEFTQWEGYFHSNNPVRDMWEEHPNATEEPWFDLDFAA